MLSWGGAPGKQGGAGERSAPSSRPKLSQNSNYNARSTALAAAMTPLKRGLKNPRPSLVLQLLRISTRWRSRAQLGSGPGLGTGTAWAGARLGPSPALAWASLGHALVISDVLFCELESQKVSTCIVRDCGRFVLRTRVPTVCSGNGFPELLKVHVLIGPTLCDAHRSPRT